MTNVPLILNWKFRCKHIALRPLALVCCRILQCTVTYEVHYGYGPIFVSGWKRATGEHLPIGGCGCLSFCNWCFLDKMVGTTEADLIKHREQGITWSLKRHDWCASLVVHSAESGNKLIKIKCRNLYVQK